MDVPGQAANNRKNKPDIVEQCARIANKINWEGEKWKGKFREPKEFKRNVMGSTAGAGSGVFHLYRQDRRAERNRLEDMEVLARQEELEKEFAEQKAEREAALKAKAEKKRAKRLKAKEAAKRKREEEKSAPKQVTAAVGGSNNAEVGGTGGGEKEKGGADLPADSQPPTKKAKATPVEPKMPAVMPTPETIVMPAAEKASDSDED